MIQYFVLTASELSTSSLGPVNQNCADSSHAAMTMTQAPPTATEAKLKFAAVSGYLCGNVKMTAAKTNQMREMKLMGQPHLHHKCNFSIRAAVKITAAVLSALHAEEQH